MVGTTSAHPSSPSPARPSGSWPRDNSPTDRVPVLRAVYAEQLRWYQAFLAAIEDEASPVNCYGSLTYTTALNDTIRELKQEMGYPLAPDNVRLPWQK